MEHVEENAVSGAGAGAATARFRDRVAVVTGAAQGIGRAIATRLSAEGATVVLVDREDEVAKVAAGLGTATHVVADLADPAQCQSVVPQVVARHGRVDVLVNNAAVLGRRYTLFDLGVDEWRRVLETNVTSAMVLGRDAARDMVARGSGAIVNMASIQERLPVSTHTAYVTSKGGISALTRAMAVELSPLGIRVNAVAPGVIDSPSMVETLQERASDTNVTPPTLLRRFGRPEEVAAAVAFLCSAEAAYITGAILPVDGGRTLSRYADPLGDF
ncbi:SDR family NAD(P)-dependent oxidoreductase [Streptomyces sp. NPDC058424]|uniref:SDR family NAD(P)-dependent oxidoreductase n=1 Tax=Streptomyces sp. NPDC058424 TaxID=3346491 RepID=UPI0036532684